jgi:hypothetical protein
MPLTSLLMFRRAQSGVESPVKPRCRRIVRRGRSGVCQREHDEGIEGGWFPLVVAAIVFF